jgi:hypothetical protein
MVVGRPLRVHALREHVRLKHVRVEVVNAAWSHVARKLAAETRLV